jgi:MFS transporter, DHA1 family, inner membrane transport protein
MATTISASFRLSTGRLIALVASRFVLNAIFRVAYPLVPFIATRFGVPVREATWIVTIQVLFGLFSPLGGWLGDRIGYRTTMLYGLGLSLIGTLGVAASPSLLLLIVAYSACGMGVSLYQPAVQAYVSALTSYEERGRAVGLIEMAWAIAGIGAVPVIAWLVQNRQGLVEAFLILSVLVAASILVTIFVLPTEAASVRSDQASSPSFIKIASDPSVLGMFTFVFLTLCGWEVLYIVQAPWVTERFNASLTDLGTAALVFGVGEMIGSLGSALLTDRMGKRRAATLSFAIAALLFLAQPFVSVNWLSYLACYMLFAIFVEFGIVASLTFATTISTVGRATVMALIVTALQVSRAIGSQVGVPVLNASSLLVNCLIAAILTLLGVVIAVHYVHEAEQAPS